MKSDRLEKFIVEKHMRLIDAMQKIDNTANGIVFVVDEKKHLCGAVSDGDIRRWLLKTGSIDAKILELMNPAPYSLHEDQKSYAAAEMEKRTITAIPIVNAEEIIVDLCLAREQGNSTNKDYGDLEDIPVIIMAGGKGTRLYPYTKILPKPLIPIGEIPIVERVIDNFSHYGMKRFFMTVNYKKTMIQSYFAEEPQKYHITYVEEEKPLGTGGSIKLITEKFDRPLFVANCDSLIRTDYSLLYKHHVETGNAITMVVAIKNDTIPYGVVYSKENGEIDHITEKPTRSYLINTGMYVINPDVIPLIPENTVFHMTNLVEKAMEQRYKVGIYPVSEDSFLDMGEFAEMKRMEEKLSIQ